MFSFSRSPATTLPNRESLRAAANSVCQENMATMAIVFVKRTRWKRPCPGEVPWQHPCCGARSVVIVFPDRMCPPGKDRFVSPGHG